MNKMTFIFFFLSVIFFSSCSRLTDKEIVNNIAEKYVKLALHVGTHSPIFVDAYYGPEEWKPKNKSTQLGMLIKDANDLITQLEEINTDSFDELWNRRVSYLKKQLLATKTYCELERGEKMSFDDQCRNLFDATSPVFEEEYFDSLHAELDKILPGKGDLGKRYNKLRENFIIPENKVEELYKAAVAEVRKRTKQFIQLPEDENFTTEYVTDEPWGAYNSV